MNVLHVVQRYWPYTGGSERHLQEIAERQAGDGHNVTVLTTDAYDLELFWSKSGRRVDLSKERHNGVDIVRVPVRHMPLSRLSYPGVRYCMWRLSQTPFDTTPVLRRAALLTPRVPDLGQVLESIPRPDVVHGMNIVFESLLVPAYAKARSWRVPFLITPLTHLGVGQGDRVSRYYTMKHQMRLEADSDAVLAQTNIEVEYLATHGVSRDKIVLAGVGVNPDEVTGGDADRFRRKYGIDRPFVFYVGTAAFDKGTFHLIEAMRLLWKKGEEADLVLAGQALSAFSGFHSRLPDHVRKRCHVLGFIPEEDKRDLLAAGSLLAMPSRTDSFGIVYLEAWLNGKPVVGARAGGVPEVIRDGEDGYLVRFGDVETLANRILFLLRDRQTAAEFGVNGKAKVLEHYTWDRIYPRVKSAYDGLVHA